MIRPSEKTRGFTLLEMLAATAIMAVLAGSLYASLYIAFKARRSALESVAAVRTATLSMDMIRADLLSAMVPNGVLAGAFVGQNKPATGSIGDTLTFYACPTDIEPGPGVGEIKKIEYYCEQSTSPTTETMLVRHITANLLAPVAPQTTNETICRKVRGFTLKYFDGSNWQDTWDSSAQNNILPTAVEVTIQFEGDAKRAEWQTSRVFMIPCAEGNDTTTSTSTGAAS